MDIDEAKARVDRLEDMRDLARSDASAIRRALETAEDEESRLNTFFLAAVDQLDAAIRAASEGTDILGSP